MLTVASLGVSLLLPPMAELPLVTAYRSDWPEAGVNPPPESLLLTVSITHAPFVRVVMFVVIELTAVCAWLFDASGPCCLALYTEMAPAEASSTVPAKETATVWAPLSGANRYHRLAH